MDRCEIEARRVAEPAFGGDATHELRAIATGESGQWLAGRVRYRAPHAMDLAISGHRDALQAITDQLTRGGWRATGEHGQAAHALRFERETPTQPDAAAGRSVDDASLIDRLAGLTKHTKRLAIFLAAGLVAAAAFDLARGRVALLAEWPSLLSLAVALTWILAAVDDFQMGTQHRIPRRVENEGARHPIAWYRWFLVHVVHPVRVPFGWLIPGSMFVVAAAYLAGILVQPAAVGALFLLANMYLFLNLRSARDDYVSLVAAQLVILVMNPGGIAAFARALGAPL